MATNPINILLVDDHQLFLTAMTALFNNRPDCRVRIANSTSRPEEVENILKTTNIDVVVLDIIMPTVSGIEILKQIKKTDPEMPVLMLSSASTAEIIQDVVANGADGFISKQADKDEIIAAVCSAYDGINYFGKDIAHLIHDIRTSKKENKLALSHREQEVVELCAQGYTCQQIAQILYVSPRTIETHKNTIFRKLGIHSSVELVKYAIYHGIITI